MKKTVTVLGLGYVGLPLFQTIAHSQKFNVWGLDINSKLIRKISTDLKKNSSRSVNVTTHPKECLPQSDFIVICVSTPITKQRQPDLTPLKSALTTVSEHLKRGQTIIIESTIYPGACEQELLPILEKSGLKGGVDFELSYCPERINPGDSRWHTSNIPRNVGSLTKRGLKQTARFYRQFIRAKIHEMDSLQETEATKLVENVFRDLNIAFANELAMAFDRTGLDVSKVIQAASNKPFSFMPHYPGVGVGGECIAADPYYYLTWLKKHGFKAQLVDTARRLNQQMPRYVVNKLIKALKKQSLDAKKSKIAVLGLSYKPGIADMRHSPSLAVIDELKKRGLKIVTHDPLVQTQSTSKSLISALKFADALIICTAQPQFIKELTAKKLKANKIKIVIDGRNCLNKDELIKAGIIYHGVGR